MTSISIDSLIKQYEVLAALGSGDRHAQDWQTKQINGIYYSPTNFVEKGWQAVSRTVINSHDSTPEAIAQIERIVKETKTILKETEFTTPYEGILHFNDVHLKLKSLKQAIKKSLPKIDVYKETVSSCSPNLVAKTEEVITNSVDRLQATKNKLTKIFNNILTPKIKYYKDIVNIHSQILMSENEKLEKTLFALFDPKNKVFQNHDDGSLNLSTICLVSKEFSTSSVKKMLYNTFGENIVKDIFQFYFKENKPVVLKLEDIRSVLVGIVANLTKDDIDHILNSKTGMAYEKIKGLSLEGNGENSVDLAKILSALRDIDLKGYKTYLSNLTDGYTYQAMGDLLFLEACLFNDHYNFKESKFIDSKVQELKKFGYTEQISRNYVYALYNTVEDLRQFRNGILFPIYNESGEIQCKEGHNIFNKNAICALGLLPVFKNENKNNDVQVAFRGTADFQSLLRDINPLERNSLTTVFTNPLTQGPGTISYNSIKVELLAKSAEFLDISLQKLGTDSINLEVMGHSLGASDVQRFLCDICSKIGDEQIRDVAYPSSFSKIDRIDLFGYNPPAVEKDICDSFITYLKEMQHDSAKKIPLKIAIRYFMSQYDLVSQTGEAFVGHGTEEFENVGVTRIEFFHPSVDGNIFGDSANSVQGGNPIESNPIQRLADAHTNFYFSEVEHNGTRKRVNPVSLCGACTNISEDKKILKQNGSLPKHNLLSKRKLSDALKSNHFFTKA